MLEIDGSFGEGGGQILRTAVSLSSLTDKPIKIINIRANRPKPGLNFQHMTSITAVVELCNAGVKGLEKGSTTIEFHPQKIQGGKYHFNILTAGSTTLVLQACLLPSLFASKPTEFRITGGTDVRWSPPIDYFRFVFAPILHKMGADVNVFMGRRGHYPKGGGEITVRVKPVSELQPLVCENQGDLKSVRGVAHVSNLPHAIANRMKNTALLKMIDCQDVSVSEEHHPTGHDPAPGTGTGIVLWANYENTVLGANGLGEKGVPAERVGQMACEDLQREMNSKATLDVHAADQFLPFMAMAKGESVFLARELSKHAKTNMWLVEKFLDVKFEIEQKDGLEEVKVKGVG